MTSTPQLIIDAMERHGVTWDDVAARLKRDEGVSDGVAQRLAGEARDGNLILITTAAIMSLINERKRQPSTAEQPPI